jgi:hypothetical protein
VTSRGRRYDEATVKLREVPPGSVVELLGLELTYDRWQFSSPGILPEPRAEVLGPEAGPGELFGRAVATYPRVLVKVRLPTSSTKPHWTFLDSGDRPVEVVRLPLRSSEETSPVSAPAASR